MQGSIGLPALISRSICITFAGQLTQAKQKAHERSLKIIIGRTGKIYHDSPPSKSLPKREACTVLKNDTTCTLQILQFTTSNHKGRVPGTPTSDEGLLEAARWSLIFLWQVNSCEQNQNDYPRVFLKQESKRSHANSSFVWPREFPQVSPFLRCPFLLALHSQRAQQVLLVLALCATRDSEARANGFDPADIPIAKRNLLAAFTCLISWIHIWLLNTAACLGFRGVKC